MKATKKRFWGTVCLVFMMIVAVACSADSNTDGGSAESAPGTSATESGSEGSGSGSDAAPQQDGIQFPLENPVNLHFWSAMTPQSKSDFNEYGMIQDMQARSNVAIDWELVLWDNLSEQFNLMLAAREIPDAFSGSETLTTAQLVRLIEEGLLIPLDELVDKHAPHIKAFFDEHPDIRASFTFGDGKLYSIPGGRISDDAKSGQVLFINKAWLDQIGKGVPGTTEEFYEVLKAFSEGDMNGNGLNDEIPFSFIYGPQTGNPGMISGAFGTMDDGDRRETRHWYAKGGELRYAPVDEGYKEYVQYMRRLVGEGLVDEEVFTHNREAYTAKIRQNPDLVGAFFGVTLSVERGTMEGNYVPVPALAGPRGEQAYALGRPGVYPTGLAITVENPDPAATIKWLDMAFEDEVLALNLYHGPQGRNWEYTDDNRIEIISPPEGVPQALWRNEESPGRFQFGLLPERIMNRQVLTPELEERYRYVEMFKDERTEDAVPVFMLSGQDAQRYNQLIVDINEYVEQKYAEWVFNGGVEGEWDAYLTQLDRLGLQEVIEIQNRYYQSYKDAMN